MIPPMTKIAAPIQPTKSAGPKVYLKIENSYVIETVVGDKMSQYTFILIDVYLGVRAPVSPPMFAPPNILNPPSAYVVNRKLCTIKLAKADTPAMPQTPKM